MINVRGMIPDLEDHYIEQLITGTEFTPAEHAAYDMWADGISGQRNEMTPAEKRRVIEIVSDSAITCFASEAAAKKYARARAHNKVRG